MRWVVRLGHQAEQDFRDILRWTAAIFGPRQAEIYAETLVLAVDALKEGPRILGAKARDEIAAGMRILPVARHGRKGRHFIVFRVGGDGIIDVLRMLHDSMDHAGHIHDASH